ncbi:valyl-tRNA synthetase [uncultured archaeon]|nr:valyl-tRNA synthetase [uncultured archaeon]
MDLNIPEMEAKWREFWDNNDIYKFNYHGGDRSEYFVIDTPPPTISGKMHMGHAFSYPHQDFIARYKRMKGFGVFYPWGFDDNGLPTERYAEKTLGIKAERMPLEEFIEACKEASDKSEEELLKTWSDIGMSADFRHPYRTVSEESRTISQKMFIDLLKKDRAYREEAPTIKCPVCHTAISQIEMRDVVQNTDFVYLDFAINGGGSVPVATTRPELIGACVAVCVSPDDDRYRGLVGKTAKVPLYGHEVKIIEDEYVDPEKGTGAEMICTFGDQNDLELWKKYSLDLRNLIEDNGKMNALSGPLEGKTVQEARSVIKKLLKSEGLISRTERIKHSVNTHERCGTPIEIGISKQWFLRYLDLKDDFLKNGASVDWLPPYMKTRYDNWVLGLKWDWCISRQRFYGVPFPLWYCDNCGETVVADENELPVDPRLEMAARKCKNCGSDDLTPETDIMDTWATSSLSPRLALMPLGLLDELYPMDIRFQGHDIISFWAFTTIVRSRIHDDLVPWKTIFISGNVYDPFGAKMSKSKGNVVEPRTVIDEYGADALRFWASTTIPGEDIKIKEQDFVRGRRTVIKIYNAAKLILMLKGDTDIGDETLELKSSLNRWITTKFERTLMEVTSEYEKFNVSRGRASLDNFFWNTFCDNYLEMIKGVLSSSEDEDLKKEILTVAFSTFRKTLCLYAPVMPFITEEAYHMVPFSRMKKSVHLESWPEFSDDRMFPEDEKEMEYVIEVIGKIRSLKTSMKLSMGAKLDSLNISGRSSTLMSFQEVIKSLMKIENISISESDEINVESGE